ncbi:hypothetical protein DFQ28_008188, partial [Apophysomyces sp. BC1034]
YPDVYNSVRLSAEFKISPEAVARILKSKFRPTNEIAQRQERNRYAAMGQRKLELQKKYGGRPGQEATKTTRYTQSVSTKVVVKNKEYASDSKGKVDRQPSFKTDQFRYKPNQVDRKTNFRFSKK